jgi:flagella basal body P-ring formation protein FlgA
MTVTDHDEQPPAPVPDRPTRTGARRGRRRPGASAAPAARFEPGRVAEARHRNPTWIVAGVLLVLLSAIGGVLLFTSTDDRTDVLVAARNLDPGRPVERADLRIQRVALDSNVASMPVAASTGLLGQHPIGRIPAGTMLSAAMFEPSVPLGAGEVVVGAALDPGEAPLSTLQVGSAVELVKVTVPAAGAEADGSATPIGTGTVWAVEEIASGQLWVSVRVGADVGMQASAAAAQDRLRVALIGGSG